ncbi:MAG: COR domain-containing protein [Bacteroidia bacterium]
MNDLEILKQLEIDLLGKNLSFAEEAKIRYVLNENKRVASLGLKDCDIVSIHRIIDHLKNLADLRTLDLSENQLVDISFLMELPKLTSLYLASNRINDIIALKNLVELNLLDLYDNEIKNISPLKNLIQLTNLTLSYNKISNISPIANLKHLKFLRLKGNQIKDISSLKDWKNLELVNLDDNKIAKLPIWITSLKIDITWDSVRYNKGISIRNNPLRSPPPEIIMRGIKAIDAWFIGQRTYVNEIKILLVGNGEVGKTTLVKCLTGSQPDLNEPPTHQIKITAHAISHTGSNIKINYWDFGGQEVMHSTHQFFLSKRSIYILVLDGRMDEDPEYWLKHIESFGGNSPILVVLNKADSNPSYDVNRQFLQDKYPFIKGFFKTICKKDELNGIQELTEGLKNAMMDVEILKSEWPKKWFVIKKNLEVTKEDFISQSHYEKLCETTGVKDKDTKEILAEFLNDLGVVVHFKDLRLENLYILQPRWASRAAYKIINSSKVAENHGLLKIEWLPEIMKKEGEFDFEYQSYTFPYIIDLMQKFELCYPIKENREYLIPELMNIQQPTLQDHQGKILNFFFKYEDFLPRSIMTRFIVRMHEDIKDNLRWRTGVVLSVPIFDSVAMIIADIKERKIKVTLSGSRRREHFAIIRKTFHEIHKAFEKLKVTEWIPLPGEDNISLEYDELIAYEESNMKDYFVGKIKKFFEVKELLNGLEPENLRKDDFQWDVFLCHSSKDKNIINAIIQELKKRNITYWLDEEQIIPGDSIIDKITDGLQKSKNLIPCISQNQMESNWSRKEYQGILSRIINGTSKQRIAPLILDDSDVENLPLFLLDTKCERYRVDKEYKRLLDLLESNSNGKRKSIFQIRETNPNLQKLQEEMFTKADEDRKNNSDFL